MLLVRVTGVLTTLGGWLPGMRHAIAMLKVRGGPVTLEFWVARDVHAAPFGHLHCEAIGVFTKAARPGGVPAALLFGSDGSAHR